MVHRYSIRGSSINMINPKFVIIFVIFIFNFVRSQRPIGDPCVQESSGRLGVCKLLTQCQHARDEVVKFQRLPQTCGFQGTQPIVCCPIAGTRKPGAISKIKCKKYSSYASEKSTSNECGHKIVKRIVGGATASRKEFAHMAALGFESNPGEIRWLCGGSIISEQYIVTLARCLISQTEGPVKNVLVGVSNLNDTNHLQKFTIEQLIPYPDFKPISVYHDIGLIKLNGTINFNSYARPACLYTEAEIRVEQAIATGWGYIEWASGVLSNDLQKVTLNFVSQEFCNMTYAKHTRKLKIGIVNELLVCAGSGGAGKDTCQGDSGGPLQIYHEDGDILCMYDLVGITSLGMGCSGQPGIYTRISHYVKWIEDIVWPEAVMNT